MSLFDKFEPLRALQAAQREALTAQQKANRARWYPRLSVGGNYGGIGRAVALELAARGAAVVVNYNKSPDAANEVVKQVQEAGGKARPHRDAVQVAFAGVPVG